MSEKTDFLVASLDYHIGRGLPPPTAWAEALLDYKAVYHAGDDRTALQRAAGRVLEHEDELAG